MKILINCNSFLKNQFTGIGRYTSNLIENLQKVDATNQYFLYAKKGLFDTKKKTPKVHAKNFHVKRDFFYRGISSFLKNIDIYHAPSLENLPNTSSNIVVTIHDCIHKAYPKGHAENTIQETESKMQQAIQKASMFICDSENTKKDVLKFYSIDPQKTKVIYPGTTPTLFYPLSKSELETSKNKLQAKGIQSPYLLFVGTIEPRKNVKGVIEAFHHLKKTQKFLGQLVIVGMYGWMQSDIFHFIENLNLKDDILFLNYISTEELRALYNHAEVFVYPSYYEGFGFPILEAFQCGTAVVTSNVSSCPEIAGDAALTVDPGNSKAISEAVLNILEDPTLKRNLEEKALHRTQAFSFQKTAQQTLEVYQSVYRATTS